MHVPPPDHEELAQPHAVGPAIPAQKHYKIIFIKAPTPPSYGRIQQQIAAQNEEKTLVYVLVKKPDSIEDIQKALPQQQLTPSKPEVYFIKYKVWTIHISLVSVNVVPFIGNLLMFSLIQAQKEQQQQFAAPQQAQQQYSAPSASSVSAAPQTSTSIDSGSSIQSFPISSAQKPAAVYGPAN